MERADALVAACLTGSRRLAHGNMSGEEHKHLNTLRNDPVGDLREAW